MKNWVYSNFDVKLSARVLKNYENNIILKYNE